MPKIKPNTRTKKIATQFRKLDWQLRKEGVDVSAFGFYDQDAFVALEKANPRALELYAQWVLFQPRDQAYDDLVRITVPKLARIVEHRLVQEQGLGACVNVATMMARMLDRLGVWSFAVRGSLTVEIPSKPSEGRRYFPECDQIDQPDNVTGHGWVVAPPFLVIDPTLKHQRWVDLSSAIATSLPTVVAEEKGDIIRPRWFDVVSDKLIAAYHIPAAELTDELPYRFKPDLAHIESFLPGRDIRIGALNLRYIAGAVTLSDRPLDEMPSISSTAPKLRPRTIWVEDVEPQFRTVR